MLLTKRFWISVGCFALVLPVAAGCVALISTPKEDQASSQTTQSTPAFRPQGSTTAVVTPYAPGDSVSVAIYRGGAACSGCAEAVTAMLLKDTRYNWKIKYIGEAEPEKLTSASLHTVDMYVQPGGGTVQEDWPKLTIEGQQAVYDYVERGGKMLGICLGGFFLGQFGDAGWGWLQGVDTYRGKKYASNTLAKTTWGGKEHFTFWEDGQYFSESGKNTRVLSRYETGQPSAIITSAGKGMIAGIGVHVEADETWYDASRSGDVDGYDYTLGHSVVGELLQSN